MASRQREATLEVFRDWDPLAPRELADQLGCSPAAARQLVRRLLKAGELRAVEGGKYALVEKSHTLTRTVAPGFASGEETHDITAESHADEDTYDGTGIGEFRISTGRMHKWVPPYA